MLVPIAASFGLPSLAIATFEPGPEALVEQGLLFLVWCSPSKRWLVTLHSGYRCPEVVVVGFELRADVLQRPVPTADPSQRHVVEL
ncbi:hypothetical protein PPSIR1_38389 [Plesiocystis pacifica SIR-1]|uniref:Uncharacterized protein n=1 Tax=Plesiocystis pacifica SIR-1 TaxID=391625 RepID=A6G8K1_9BACT|nr:hypothetical protein PPSIR1_38389 [Plesiocystis pacifica SIR-1]